MTKPGEQEIFVFNEHEREDVGEFCRDGTLDGNYMLRGQEGLIGLLAHLAKHADKAWIRKTAKVSR